MQFSVQHWAKSDSPDEGALRKILAAEGLTPYAWSNRPGDRYAAHKHDYDKVIYVLRGSITWILPESNRKIETRASDRIELPGGTLHAAHVGPQGVICLEAHSH